MFEVIPVRGLEPKFDMYEWTLRCTLIHVHTREASNQIACSLYVREQLSSLRLCNLISEPCQDMSRDPV